MNTKPLILALSLSCVLPSLSADYLRHNGERYPITKQIEGIPQPPLGKRWVLNEQFSDEFNGSRLDSKKWLDHHPNWQGRAPGLFEAKNISLKDGYLILKGEKMRKPQIITSPSGTETTYNISCAAVVSRSLEAHYGYYECRFKANQTTLSSTFWLSSRGQVFETKGRQPEGAAEGKFHQELDICECIGRTGDFSGKNFYKGMNANVHYWFTPTGGTKQDIRIQQTDLQREDGKVPSDDFNTYGCWWRDEENASFYLNNEQETHREFISKDKKVAFRFTEPMGLNMVVETYMEPWISLPKDSELADKRKNHTTYDWVRSYTLVDADAPTTGRVDAAIFPTQLRFCDKPEVVEDELQLELAYSSAKDCDIILSIINSDNKSVFKKTIKAKCGYTHEEMSIPLNRLKAGTYIALIRTLDKKAVKGDSFKFKLK